MDIKALARISICLAFKSLTPGGSALDNLSNNSGWQISFFNSKSIYSASLVTPTDKAEAKEIFIWGLKPSE